MFGNAFVSDHWQGGFPLGQTAALGLKPESTKDASAEIYEAAKSAGALNTGVDRDQFVKRVAGE